MEIDTEVTCSSSPSSSYHAKGAKKIKLDVNVTSSDELTEREQESSILVNRSPRLDLLEEYEFLPTDPKNFLKAGKPHTVSDMFEILKSTNMQRRDHMAVAELCPKLKRPRLIINKGNVDGLYGFDIEGETYFHPEEALYLIETGKLELLTEGVAVSVERARLLLIQSKLMPSCSAADYSVYKHFAEMGYRLRRRIPEYLSQYPPDLETCETESIGKPNPMDQDLESTQPMDEAESHSRGIKRVAGSLQPEPDDVVDSGISTTVSSTKGRNMERLSSVIEEPEDSDCEFIEEIEKESNPYARVSVHEDDDETDLAPGDPVTMDEAFFPSAIPHYSGAAAASPPSPSLPYTVVEYDSDVEFVDEVSPYAVRIEEIPSDTDSLLSCEAGPSTSKGPQVYVDLVSSESENEDAVECDYYEPIWSKCIPNSKIQFEFPPSSFLPGNITHRSGLFEFNLGNCPEQNSSTDDVEIETILDRVHLETNGESPSGGSWKEWRETLMSEATNVFNESLLGKARIEGECNGTWNWREINTSKLYQWESANSETEQNRAETKSVYMPYDLYPISASQIHRRNLGFYLKPTHRIAVVREDELIPNAEQFPTTDEGASLVVVVVGKDSSIVQLLCNSQPIQSLC